MNWISAALIAIAAVPIGRACWANRKTALAHTFAWVLATWLTWIAAAVTPSASTRYMALSMTACAGVSVLGARRPGVAAWNAVVAALLTVLLVPLANRILFDGPRPNDTAYAVFLQVILLVVIGNYISTRLTFAAVVLAVGCHVELIVPDGFIKFGPAGDNFLAQLLIGLAPWLGWLRMASRPAVAWEGDRLWRDFRDRFGVVWAQRVREQFNRAAVNAQLSVELGWRGLRRFDAAPLTPADQTTSLELLQALMQRFN